ncbi:hypothetical protein OC842_003020 [Tilletia horrida]|uniref:DUF1742-domain-containing protein n=1 Tax=Tilletia horrida TaxID=155126 RepID=A0AAN6GDK9_9BASI|nr:hypothetical protein OC842_003020 [Tilletia horrida]
MAQLGNHYIRRLAGTPKPCLICYRPSPVVLVSVALPTQDFFYCCPSHLADRHFATRIPSASASASGGGAGAGAAQDKDKDKDKVPGRLPDKVSKEEIDKVTREWKERQQKKEAAAAAAKDKEKESSSSSSSKGWLSTVAGAAGTAASGVYSLASSAIASSSSPSDPSTADPRSAAPPAEAPLPPGQHEHYQLHKDIFAMRKDTFNKRAALKRAQELNMPAVPSRVPGNLPPSNAAAPPR